MYIKDWSFLILENCQQGCKSIDNQETKTEQIEIRTDNENKIEINK